MIYVSVAELYIMQANQLFQAAMVAHESYRRIRMAGASVAVVQAWALMADSLQAQAEHLRKLGEANGMTSR